MLVFHGICRKAVFLPLATLLVGWVVYLVGFSLFIHKQDTGSSIDNLPLYIATATPPLLVLLAVVHAALSGVLSSIFGLVTAILSVTFVTSTGYVFYTSAATLYQHLHPLVGTIASLDANCVLMLTGSLLSCLSWTCILVMWHGYVYKPHQHYYNLDEIDEDGAINSPRPRHKISGLFSGIARKLTVLFLVLEAGSWCVLVKGVDDELKTNSSYLRSNFSYLPFQELVFEAALPFDVWVGSVVGVILIISALFHAAKSSALMGTLVSLLSMLFLVCMGHLVFSQGLEMNLLHKHGIDFLDFQMYQLGGGIGCCVFWACVLALWPFYSAGAKSRYDNSAPQQRQYLFGNEEKVPLLYQSNEHKAAPTL